MKRIIESVKVEELLALFCADIDIFLLQDEAQQNDLDKLYTKDEIREQLKKSLIKFISLPDFLFFENLNQNKMEQTAVKYNYCTAEKYNN
jgi:hypothetical protein